MDMAFQLSRANEPGLPSSGKDSSIPAIDLCLDREHIRGALGWRGPNFAAVEDVIWPELEGIRIYYVRRARSRTPKAHPVASSVATQTYPPSVTAAHQASPSSKNLA